MSTKRPWVATLCGLLLTLPALGAVAPRADINPALLYWQAFSLSPKLSKEQASSLPTLGRDLSQSDLASLARKLDPTAKLLRRAAESAAPCDWGSDPAEGPQAVLPNLAKIRSTAQGLAILARYHLLSGQPQLAAQDLRSALALARDSANGSGMVGVGIEMNIEELVAEFAAAHLSRWDAASLQSVLEGFNSVRRAVSVRDAMRTEKSGNGDWLAGKIQQAQAQAGGDDARAVRAVRDLLEEAFGAVAGKDWPDKLVAAAGGTISGLLDYVKQLDPIYAQSEAVAAAGPEEFPALASALQKTTQEQQNLLTELLMPRAEQGRRFELRCQAIVAMLRAGAAYKASGEAGLRGVTDPLTGGVFTVESSAGSGFKLRSGVDKLGLGVVSLSFDTQPATK